jgi:hypothetical protein
MGMLTRSVIAFFVWLCFKDVTKVTFMTTQKVSRRVGCLYNGHFTGRLEKVA